MKGFFNIFDCWYIENFSRFLIDNFGIYYCLFGMSMYLSDVRLVVILKMIVDNVYYEDKRFGVLCDLDCFVNEEEVFYVFVNGDVISVFVVLIFFVLKLEV